MSIFLLGWFYFSIVAFLFLYLRKQGYGIKATDTHLMVTKQQPQKQLPATEIDWDEEFLRAEAAKHTVDRIEETEVFYVSERKNPNRKIMPGFNCYCTCGHRISGLNLKHAEAVFERHKKEKQEAALAQLGRFK